MGLGAFFVAVTVSDLFPVMVVVVILTRDDDNGDEDDDGGCEDDDSLKRLSLMAHAIIRSVALPRSNIHEV